MVAFTPDQYPFRPQGESTPVDPAELLVAYSLASTRSVDLHDTGLVHPDEDLPEGISSLLYTQARVSSWDSRRISEGDIVKIRTMHVLTENGQALEELLRDQGELTTKEIGAWRVNRQWLRDLSIDEIPQLPINVMGIGSRRYPNRLSMKLFGGGRPLLKEEIQHLGDNSNDHFGRALSRFAEARNCSPTEMHSWLGSVFVPGLVTPATARGKRQLDTEEGFAAWMQGILEYAEMTPLQRYLAMWKVILKTSAHVIRRTDAS